MRYTNWRPLPLPLPIIIITLHVAGGAYLVYIHRVPKSATPLASNTFSSVCSSWISTKYHTLHYLNITYRDHCDVRIIQCVLSVTTLWHQSLFTMYRATKQQCIRKASLCGSKWPNWPLWAQTLKISLEWLSQ